MGNSRSRSNVDTSLSLEHCLEKPKCVICFEDDKSGLKCEYDHHMCHECITPYITSVISDVGRLKDQDYCIRCPVMENKRQCRSIPLNAVALLENTNPETLNKYVKTLSDICSYKYNPSAVVSIDEKSPVVPKMLDALNLRCPNRQCHVVMDPSPDGCCAVRCGSCATYTCFLCFQVCANGDACHKHVRECIHSPKPEELFISEIDRVPTHKRVRVLALRTVLAREFLQPILTDKTAQDLEDPDGYSSRLGELLALNSHARRCLTSIHMELRDVYLTPQDVFDLNTRPTVRAQLATFEEQQARRRRGLVLPAPAIRRRQADAPAGEIDNNNENNGRNMWRTASLSVVTFLVVFSIALYFFYWLGGDAYFFPYQREQNNSSTFGEPLASPLNFTMVPKCTAFGELSYDEACNITQVERVRRIATGFESDCNLWDEPKIMIFVGTSLVTITWILVVLGLLVLAGFIVFDAVTVQR